MDSYVRASPAACGFLERVGGTQHEIKGRQWRIDVFPAELPVGADLKVQRVAPINQHEDRLQQVVPIVSAACDVQEQIQFGGGWDVVKRKHEKRLMGKGDAQDSLGLGV